MFIGSFQYSISAPVHHRYWSIDRDVQVLLPFRQIEVLKMALSTTVKCVPSWVLI